MFGGPSSHIKKAEDEEWLYPFLAGYEDGCSSVTTKALRNHHPAVDGLPSDCLATGLRVGGLNEILSKEHVGEYEAFGLGGWVKKDSAQSGSRGEIYKHADLNTVIRASAALNGWNPRGRVYPPSMDLIITTLNLAHFQNFSIALFDHGVTITTRPRLRGFCWCMLASLIMYYQYVYDEYGGANLVVSTMLNISQRFNFTHEMFIAWSVILWEDFQRKNLANMTHGDGLTGMAIDRLVAANLSLRTLLESSNSRLARVEQSLITSNSKIDKLLVLFSTFHATGSGSPSSSEKKKRLRSDDTPDLFGESAASKLVLGEKE